MKHKKNDIVMWFNDKGAKVFGRVFKSKKISQMAIDVGYTWLPFVKGRQYFVVPSPV